MIKIKRIKKYLSLFLLSFFLLFGLIQNVSAQSEIRETFSKGSKRWNNYYYTREDANGHRSWNIMTMFIRDSDGRAVYCIEPGVSIDYENIYPGFTENHAALANLTKEEFQQISLIAYFGYGYKDDAYDHTDPDWWAVTQWMIWQTASNGYRIYMTERQNTPTTHEPEIQRFTDEMAEINNLIDKYYTLPRFDTDLLQNMVLGDTISLTDKSAVLNGYEVASCTNCIADPKGNELQVTATGVGQATLILKKIYNAYNNDPIVYIREDAQNVMATGNIDPNQARIRFNVLGGTVKINKVDSDNNNNIPQGEATLKGAVFGIYNTSDERVGELTTDENGYAESGILPSVGRFYLLEEVAPKGYEKSTEKYYFSITDTEIHPIVKIANNVIKGQIALQKVDSETNTAIPQGQATLKGAKYGVYDKRNNLVDTLITDEHGYALSIFLPYGNYTIRELESSLGYEIDATIYSVNIVEKKSYEVESKEKVIKGQIELQKVDSKTNLAVSEGQASLKSAKYGIYDKDNNLVDTLITNENGYAISKFLPFGNYTIRELESSLGYEINTEIVSINITRKEVYSMTSKEKVITNFISILKQYDFVDGDTTFLNAESGITFEIYYPNGTLFDTITTDKNGYATIEMPYGKWRFHQANTNDGFEKIHDFYIIVDETSSKEHYYNILNNKLSAYLQVVKIDSETGKAIAIAGATFKIYNMDTKEYVSQYVGGKIYNNFTTDENGKFITYLKLESGHYKLVEISSPKNYLLSDEDLEFTIGDDTYYTSTTYGLVVTIYFSNQVIKGKLEINKTGEAVIIENGKYIYEKIPLDQVTYEIHANEDILSADGKTIYYKKGQLVETLTTDVNGYAISLPLYLGSYYLVEVKTKDSHVLNTEKWYFTLTAQDDKTPIVYKSYSNLNLLKKGTLIFSKTDLTTGVGIANTKIKIFQLKEDDILDLIFAGVTDNDGKITIDNLFVGKFIIIETDPATGYRISDEIVAFEIKENGEIVKANMTNEKITSIIKIHKVDNKGKSLSGVEFGIYDLEDNLIKTLITDENGDIEVELEYGLYKYKELNTIEGYVLNEEIGYFEVTNDSEVIELTMTNEKLTSTIIIHKVDEDGNCLAGVEIGIFDLENRLLGSYVTDENGNIEIDLEYGNYYYQEIQTIDGYFLNDEKVFFNVTEDGAMIESTLVNVKVPNTSLSDSKLIDIVGIILIVVGVGYLIYAKKKK